MLLEEVDFFPVHASDNADYRDFMTALVNTVVRASGRDCIWARALPALSRALELLSQPNFWAFGGGGVSVWGQRPN